jgi:hypothetical protein
MAKKLSDLITKKPPDDAIQRVTPDEAIQRDTEPELLRVGKVSGRGTSLDFLRAFNRVWAEPFNYRAAGRRRLERAFNRMRESTKHMNSVDAYEMVGELDQLMRGDDSAIADDRAAGSMFYGIATALELAFDLGRYEGGDRGAREAVVGRAKRNGKKGAAKKSADADLRWRGEAKLLYDKFRGPHLKEGDPLWKSQRNLAAIICDTKRGVKGAPEDEDNVRKQIRKWDKESRLPGRP